jgi:hypothetical protein
VLWQDFGQLSLHRPSQQISLAVVVDFHGRRGQKSRPACGRRVTIFACMRRMLYE